MSMTNGRLLALLLPAALGMRPAPVAAQAPPVKPGNIMAPGGQFLPPGPPHPGNLLVPGAQVLPPGLPPPGNILFPGVQVLPPGPQPRVVPFTPQNTAAAADLSLSALQQRILVVRSARALALVQQRQLAALMREQLELSLLQQDIAQRRRQPLTPVDEQQLTALEGMLNAMQQQNLAQQLAVMQP